MEPIKCNIDGWVYEYTFQTATDGTQQGQVPTDARYQCDRDVRFVVQCASGQAARRQICLVCIGIKVGGDHVWS